MQDFLVVVDMQNDFIDGALGSDMAGAIVEGVAEKIASFAGGVIFTRDTHTDSYLDTREGRLLPVPHCIKGTEGWQLHPKIKEVAGAHPIIDKPTFGSTELASRLLEENEREKIGEVTLVGLCTDICVISCAMLVKATLPEAEVTVISHLCAGVSEESHKTALSAMKACQINVK